MGTTLLKDSNKKVQFSRDYSELALEVTRKISASLTGLGEVANGAQLAIISRMTNVMCETSGTEKGFFKLISESCGTIKGIAEGLAKEPGLDSALRSRAKQAADILDEAKAAASKDPDRVPIPEDGNEDWTTDKAAQVNELLIAISGARRDYILRLKESYTKNYCEDIAPTFRKIGKTNEDTCNDLTIAINKIGGELEKLGVHIQTYFANLDEEARGLMAAVSDVGTGGTGIAEGGVEL